MNVEFAASDPFPPVAQSRLVVQGDVSAWTSFLHAEAHSEHALERRHHTAPGDTGWLHTPLGRELARASYGAVPVATLARASYGVRAFLIYAHYAAQALRQYLPVAPFGSDNQFDTSTAYSYNRGYYIMRVDTEGVSRDSPEALGGLLVLHYAPNNALHITLLQLGSRYDDGTGGLFVRVYEMSETSVVLAEFTTQALIDMRFGHPRGAVGSARASRTRSDAARETPAGVLRRALLSAIGLDASTPEDAVASFTRHKLAGASLVNFFTTALYSAISQQSLAPLAALANIAVLEFPRILVQMSAEERAAVLHALPQRMPPALIEHVLELLTNVYGLSGVRELVDLESWAAAILTSGAQFARFHTALVHSDARKRKAADDDKDTDRPSMRAGAIDEEILKRILMWLDPRDMRGLSLATRDLARKTLIFGNPVQHAHAFDAAFPFLAAFVRVGTVPPSWISGGSRSAAARLVHDLRADAVHSDRLITGMIRGIVRLKGESADALKQRRADRTEALRTLQARRIALLTRIDPVLNATALDTDVRVERIREWQLYHGLVERALTNPALRRLLPTDIGGGGSGSSTRLKLVDASDVEARLSADSATRWELTFGTINFRNTNVFTMGWGLTAISDEDSADKHISRLRGLYYVTLARDDASVEHTLAEVERNDDGSIQRTIHPSSSTLSLLHLVNDPSRGAKMQWPKTAFVEESRFYYRNIAWQSLTERFRPMLQMVDRRLSTVEVRYVTRETRDAGALKHRAIAGGLWAVTDKRDMRFVEFIDTSEQEHRPWLNAPKRRLFVYAAADRTMMLAFMQHAERVLDNMPDTAEMTQAFRGDVRMNVWQIRQECSSLAVTKDQWQLLTVWPFHKRWSNQAETMATLDKTRDIALRETVYNSLSIAQRAQVDMVGAAYDPTNNTVFYVWTRNMRRYYREWTMNKENAKVIIATLTAVAAQLFNADSPEQKHSSPLELAWLRFMYVRAAYTQLGAVSVQTVHNHDMLPRLPVNRYMRSRSKQLFSTWFETAVDELEKLVGDLRTAPLRRAASRPATDAQLQLLSANIRSTLDELHVTLQAVIDNLSVFSVTYATLSTDSDTPYKDAVSAIVEQMQKMALLHPTVALLKESDDAVAGALESLRNAFVATQNDISLRVEMRAHDVAIDRATAQLSGITHSVLTTSETVKGGARSLSAPIVDALVKEIAILLRGTPDNTLAAADKIAALALKNPHRHPELVAVFLHFVRTVPEYVSTRHAGELNGVRAEFVAENELQRARALLRSSFVALDGVSDVLDALAQRVRQAVGQSGAAFESELKAMSVISAAVVTNKILLATENTLQSVKEVHDKLYPNFMASMARNEGPASALEAVSQTLLLSEPNESFSVRYIASALERLLRLRAAFELKAQNYDVLARIGAQINAQLRDATEILHAARVSYRAALAKQSSEETDAEKMMREEADTERFEAGQEFDHPPDAFEHIVILSAAFRRAYREFDPAASLLRRAAKNELLGNPIMSEVLGIVEEERRLIEMLPAPMEEDLAEDAMPTLIDPVQGAQQSSSSSSTRDASSTSDLSSVLQITTNESFKAFLADPRAFALDVHELDVYYQLPDFSAIDDNAEIRDKKLDWVFVVYGVRDLKRVAVAKGGLSGVLDGIANRVTIELFVVTPKGQGHGRRILRFVRDKLRSKQISLGVSRIQLRTAASFWAQMESENILGPGSFDAAFTTATGARQKAQTVRTGARGGKWSTLRERIEALDRACGAASRLAPMHSSAWRSIVQHNLVPHGDLRGKPMALADVVKIRGRCVSKRDISVLTKWWRDVIAAPPWPFEGASSAPFTANELRAAGLDPQQFRFFRSTAAPAAPRTVALELDQYVAYVEEIDAYSGEDIVEQLYASVTYQQFYEAVLTRLMHMSQRSERHQRKPSTVVEVQSLIDSNVELTIAHLEDDGQPHVAVLLQWEPHGWVKTQLDIEMREADIQSVYASAIEHILADDFIDYAGRRYAPSTIDDIDRKLRMAVERKWPNTVIALVAVERAWGKTRLTKQCVFTLMVEMKEYGAAASALSAWRAELRSACGESGADILALLNAATVTDTGVKPHNGGDKADDDDDTSSVDEELVKRRRLAAAARKKMVGLNAHLIDKQIIARIQLHAGIRGTRGLRLATRHLARTAVLFTAAKEVENDFIRIFPFFKRLFQVTAYGTRLPQWMSIDDKSAAVMLAERLRDGIGRYDEQLSLRVRELRLVLARSRTSAAEIAQSEAMLLERSHRRQTRRQTLLARIDPLLRADALDTTLEVGKVRRWHMFAGLVERALTNPVLRSLLPSDIGGTSAVAAESRLSLPTTLSRAPSLVDSSALEALLVKHNAPVDAWRRSSDDAPFDDMFSIPSPIERMLLLELAANTMVIELTGLYYVAQWEDRQLIEHALVAQNRDVPSEIGSGTEITLSRIALVSDPPTGYDAQYNDQTAYPVHRNYPNIIQDKLARVSRHLGPRYFPMLQVRDSVRATLEARVIVTLKTSEVEDEDSTEREYRTIAGGLWKVTAVDDAARVAIPTDTSSLRADVKLFTDGPLSAEPKRRIFTYAAADRTAFMSLMADAGRVLDALPDTERMREAYWLRTDSVISRAVDRGYVSFARHGATAKALIDAYRSVVFRMGDVRAYLMNKPILVTTSAHADTNMLGLVYDNVTGDIQLAWNVTTRRYYQLETDDVLNYVPNALKKRAAELFDPRLEANKHASALELAFLRYLYMGAGYAQFHMPRVDKLRRLDAHDASELFRSGYSSEKTPFGRWRVELEKELRKLVIDVRGAPISRAFRKATPAQMDALRLDTHTTLVDSSATLDESIALLTAMIQAKQMPEDSEARVPISRGFMLAFARTLTPLAAELTDLAARTSAGAPKEKLAIYADDLAAVTSTLRHVFESVAQHASLIDVVDPIGGVLSTLSAHVRRMRQAEGPRGFEFEQEMTNVVTELLSFVNWAPTIAALKLAVFKHKNVVLKARAMLAATALYKSSSKRARAISERIEEQAPMMAETGLAIERLLLVVQLQDTRPTTLEKMAADVHVLIDKLDQRQLVKSVHAWYLSAVDAWREKSKMEHKLNGLARMVEAYVEFAVAANDIVDFFDKTVGDELFIISYGEGTQSLSMLVADLVKKERSRVFEEMRGDVAAAARAMDEDDIDVLERESGASNNPAEQSTSTTTTTTTRTGTQTKAIVVRSAVRSGHARDSLHARIVALDRVCGEASRLAPMNSAEWRRIVARGLVPQRDAAGNAMLVADVVKIRGRCVSKRDIYALTRDYRNVDIAPLWPFGAGRQEPFTRDELRLAGLDPRQFRHFRGSTVPAAPAVLGRPPTVALELDEYLSRYSLWDGEFADAETIDDLYSTAAYHQFYAAVLRLLLRLSQHSEVQQLVAHDEVLTLIDSNVEVTVAHLDDNDAPDVTVLLQWEPMGWVSSQLDMSTRANDLPLVYASAIEHIVSSDWVDGLGRPYAMSAIKDVDANLRAAVANHWPNAVVALVAVQSNPEHPEFEETELTGDEVAHMITAMRDHARAASALAVWHAAGWGAATTTTGARNGKRKKKQSGKADDDDTSGSSSSSSSSSASGSAVSQETVAKRKKLATNARTKMADLNTNRIDKHIMQRIQRYAGVRGARGFRLATRHTARVGVLFTSVSEAETDFRRIFPFFGRLFNVGTFGRMPAWTRLRWTSTALILAQRLRDTIMRHDRALKLRVEHVDNKMRADGATDAQITTAVRELVERALHLQARREALLTRIDPLLRTTQSDVADSVEEVREWHLFAGVVERALGNATLRGMLPRDIGGVQPTAAPSSSGALRTLSRAPTLAHSSALETMLHARGAPPSWNVSSAAPWLQNVFVTTPGLAVPNASPTETTVLTLTGLYYVAMWDDRSLLEYALVDQLRADPAVTAAIQAVGLTVSSPPLLLHDPPTAYSLEYTAQKYVPFDSSVEMAISARSWTLGPRYNEMVQQRDPTHETIELRYTARPGTPIDLQTSGRVVRTVAGGLWQITDVNPLQRIAPYGPLLPSRPSVLSLLATGPLSAEAKRRVLTYAAADRTAFLALKSDAARIIDALPDTAAMRAAYLKDVTAKIVEMMSTAPAGVINEETRAAAAKFTLRNSAAMEAAPIVVWSTATVSPIVRRLGILLDPTTDRMQLTWSATTRRMYRVSTMTIMDRAVTVVTLRERADALFDPALPTNAGASALELAFLRYLYAGAAYAQQVAPDVYFITGLDVSYASNLYSPGQFDLSEENAFAAWVRDLTEELHSLASDIRRAPITRAFLPADAQQRATLAAQLHMTLVESAGSVLDAASRLHELVRVKIEFGSDESRYSMNANFVLPVAEDLGAAGARLTQLSAFEMGTLTARADKVAEEIVSLRRIYHLILPFAPLTPTSDQLGEVVDRLGGFVHRLRQAAGPHGLEFEREMNDVTATLGNVDWLPIIEAIKVARGKLEHISDVVGVLRAEIAVVGEGSSESRQLAIMLDSLIARYTAENPLQTLHRMLTMIESDDVDAQKIETLSMSMYEALNKLQATENEEDEFHRFTRIAAEWKAKGLDESYRYVSMQRILAAFSDYIIDSDAVNNYYDYAVGDVLSDAEYGAGTTSLIALVAALTADERELMADETTHPLRDDEDDESAADDEDADVDDKIQQQ